MVKRYHCEFKNCNCVKFELFCSGKCKHCNHGSIWHSLKEHPPTTFETQFVSPRVFARIPIYVYNDEIERTIFTPIPVVNAFPIEDNFRDYNFCITVEALPV
jgi:hypothetical protein